MRLIDQIPWDIFAAWLIANLIPYLSALATKAPSWATGAITVVLAFVTAFLTTLAAAGTDIDWKKVLFTTLTTWGVAFLHHKAVSQGETENVIHARFGNKGSAVPVRQAA